MKESIYTHAIHSLIKAPTVQFFEVCSLIAELLAGGLLDVTQHKMDKNVGFST